MKLSKKPVNGMKEILPAEMKIRDYAISVIKETYAKFGFTSIETPCMEHIENLCSKQGGENEKLIFKVLKRGEKLNLETAATEADPNELTIKESTIPASETKKDSHTAGQAILTASFKMSLFLSLLSSPMMSPLLQIHITAKGITLQYLHSYLDYYKIHPGTISAIL
jgi:hypothetical protein